MQSWGFLLIIGTASFLVFSQMEGGGGGGGGGEPVGTLLKCCDKKFSAHAFPLKVVIKLRSFIGLDVTHVHDQRMVYSLSIDLSLCCYGDEVSDECLT